MLKRKQSHNLFAMFEAQVQKNPSRIILFTNHDTFTFQELYEAAQNLSHALAPYISEPDTLIAIRGERSPEFIIAILGCLMAGGAYIPLDLSYTAEDLQYILKDSQPKIHIHIEYEKREGKLGQFKIHSSLRKSQNTSHFSYKNVLLNHLAYICYTSGLTGDPKGVMIEHRSICARIDSLKKIYGLTQNDIFFHNSPYGFDGSVEEIFLPLLTGCPLVVAPQGQVFDILEATIEFIERFNITTLYLTPPLWVHFGRWIENKEVRQSCKSLKRLIGGGDVLLPATIEKLQSLLPIEYYYIYGPTENTINSTIWRCQWRSGMKVVPVGKPLFQTQVYILDSNRMELPPNEIGEIYLAGVGLARGYLNKKELTKDRFQSFNHQPRMYKTRDLGRFLSNGLMEYIGRKESFMPIEDYCKIPYIQSFLSFKKEIRSSVFDIVDGKVFLYLSLFDAPLPPHAKHRYLKELAPFNLSIDQIIFLPSFEYTASGKIDIMALRKSYSLRKRKISPPSRGFISSVN
jgi:microcystin synthetase protein McyC